MIPYAISIKYMLVGYAVIFIVLTIYIASLFIRWQRQKHDLHTFENLQNHH